MSKNVNEKNASLCFLCNTCEKKRKSKANISINYLLMSCILIVNVQTQTLPVLQWVTSLHPTRSAAAFHPPEVWA